MGDGSHPEIGALQICWYSFRYDEYVIGMMVMFLYHPSFAA
jgi:hypothetical protein